MMGCLDPRVGSEEVDGAHPLRTQADLGMSVAYFEEDKLRGHEAPPRYGQSRFPAHRDLMPVVTQRAD